MMKSWEKQVLNHVNNDVNIFQDGKLVLENARVLNIDLINNRIVLRKDFGDGQQVTVFGGSIVIEDVHNYRLPQSDYEGM